MSSPQKKYPNKAARKRAYRQRRAARRRAGIMSLPPLPPRNPRRLRNPRPQLLRGQGDYKEVAKGFGSRAGEIAAESILGLMGLGDYRARTIKSNSLLKGRKIDFGEQKTPAVMNDYDGTVTISHQEYAGDIYVTSDSKFHYQKYGLNPANQALFPWLSKVANNFQQWKLNGAIVHLKSMASNYTNNVSLGTIFAGIQYNYYGRDPTNMRDIANLDGSCTAKSSKDIIIPIECARRQTTVEELYIDNPGNIADGDERFNYMGNLFVGCEGVKLLAGSTDPLTLFQVWISYEVKLMKPILADSEGTFDTLKLNSPNLNSTVDAGSIESLNFGDISQQVGSNSEITWGYADPVNHNFIRFTLPSYPAKYLITAIFHCAAVIGSPTFQFGLTLNPYCVLDYQFPGAAVNSDDHLFSPGDTTVMVPNRNQVSTFVVSVTEDPIDSNVPYFDLNNGSGPIASTSCTGTFTVIVTQIEASI